MSDAHRKFYCSSVTTADAILVSYEYHLLVHNVYIFIYFIYFQIAKVTEFSINDNNKLILITTITTTTNNNNNN